jgi:hypothetical protein
VPDTEDAIEPQSLAEVTSAALTLSSPPHTITLFETTGRLVLQQRTTDARPMIATEALPAGLYQIAVRDEQGVVMGATWIKEWGASALSAKVFLATV